MFSCECMCKPWNTWKLCSCYTAPMLQQRLSFLRLLEIESQLLPLFRTTITENAYAMCKPESITVRHTCAYGIGSKFVAMSIFTKMDFHSNFFPTGLRIAIKGVVDRWILCAMAINHVTWIPYASFSIQNDLMLWITKLRIRGTAKKKSIKTYTADSVSLYLCATNECDPVDRVATTTLSCILI